MPNSLSRKIQVTTLKPCNRYGRKPAVLAPYFIAGCFSFGTAAAKDIQTILITRFFAGIFGSAPVTNTGGVLGDIWPPQHRGTAIVFYAFAVVGGPSFGVSFSLHFLALNRSSLTCITIILTLLTANCWRCNRLKLSPLEMD